MGRKSNKNVVKENQRKALTRQRRDDLNRLVDVLLQKCASSVLSGGASKDWDAYVEVWELVVKIGEIERTLTRSVVKRSDAVAPFLSWLKEHGAVTGPVELIELPVYGFCVRASEPIKEEELVFSIPEKVMLSVNQSSSIGSFIANDPILGRMPNVALSFQLLSELYSPNSFWKPYLDVLPHSYDTILYFTPEEMNELKGSPAQEEALRMFRSICRQYAYFYTLLQKGKEPSLSHLRSNFTFDDYRWAVSTVMTRQNLIPRPDGVQVNTLIPLWDFCNHRQGKFSTDFRADDRRCHCSANCDYDRGDQVFIYYGDRTCADQLIHNGFVDVNNSCDGVTLKLGLSKSDPLASKRLALLTKLSITSDENQGPIPFQLHCGNRPISGRLLAFLRLFCMDQVALQHWLDSSNCMNLLHEECGIETEVEDKCWSFLTARCRLLLRLYPNTIEQDLDALQVDLSQRHRMCVLLRLAEKRVLMSTIDYACRKCNK